MTQLPLPGFAPPDNRAAFLTGARAVLAAIEAAIARGEALANRPGSAWRDPLPRDLGPLGEGGRP